MVSIQVRGGFHLPVIESTVAANEIAPVAALRAMPGHVPVTHSPVSLARLERAKIFAIAQSADQMAIRPD